MNIETRTRRFNPDISFATLSGERFDLDEINSQMPILGIDGSVAKIGFSLIVGNQIKAWKWAAPSAARGLVRLDIIRRVVTDLITTQHIKHAVIEGYSFGSKNSQSHATGEAGATIRMACRDLGVNLIECPPTVLKKFITGKGNSPKTAIPLHLYKRYSVAYSNEDEADAAVLATLGAAQLGQHHGKLHKYQEDALASTVVLC